MMLVQVIADQFNLSAWSVRLMMSILMGYPLGVLHLKVVRHMDAMAQHIFMATSGALLFVFNFGVDIYHSALNILLVFAIIRMVGVNRATVAFVFLQQTAYLLVGCLSNNSGLYVVDWTTPQCVLCLRLVGLVWDLYDGARKKEELSASQRESALVANPTLIEMLGFCYFFGGFLCGPQFSMRRYLDCVEGRLISTTSTSGSPIQARQVLRTIYCGCQGFACLAIFFLSNSFFYEEAFDTHWFFEETTFFQRILYMTGFGNLVLFRYLAVWKLVEGASVLVGLGYNGEDSKGQVQHDAMANVHLGRFLCGSSCNDMVNSFNTNTNKWMLEYIYKRLRFLNNRVISQVVTLFYLALWHGAYSGYFLNFFLEFTVLVVEKDLLSMLERSWINPLLNSPVGKIVSRILARLAMLFIIGQALVAFCLLRYELWFPVYKSVYFCAFVFCLWHPLRPVIRLILAPRRSAPSAGQKQD